MSELTRFYHLSYRDESGKQHIFYVGRTARKLSERLRQHRRDAKKGKTRKGKLMQALAAQGLTVEITEIARTNTYDRAVVAAIEDTLIERHILEGHELCNSSTGNSGAIPGDTKSKQWEPEVLKLLGTMDDTKLAQQLGLSIDQIKSKRRTLNIPAYTYGKWTQEILSLLGTMPDAELARQTGLPVSDISKKRRKEGLERYLKPWVWTEERDKLLGTMMDKLLAEHLGIGIFMVFARRKKLGIPAYKP